MPPEILLSCESLSRSHGTRVLFEGVSFGIAAGDRIGVVGPNGSGKTTLLRILAGLEEPDDGSVMRRRFLRLGFVEQSPQVDPAVTAEEVVASGLSDLGLDEHEIVARAGIALGKAGFPDGSVLAGSLSGGWRKRLAIARELAREPEVLLLDEPTNHLDLEGILALEEILRDGSFASLIVTHDRWLLQDVATRMLELNRQWAGGTFTFRGSYADFLEKREEAVASQQASQASLANVVRREIEWLRRGPKARTTKSEARIREAERLKSELAASRARTATRSADIDFVASDRQSRRLLVVHAAGVKLGERRVLQPFDLTLVNGMRLGILGTNGSGKTTLLRLLHGELAPSEGRVERAPSLKVIRFEQDRSTLDPKLSLKRALAPEGDAVTFRGERVHVSSWARRFLFRNEQLEVAVGKLSGGEQARILIARLMLQAADVLLLDEPTNDLDIPTLEILEESLAEFPGALVLVTHDRFMLERVSTTLLSVEDDGRIEAFMDLAQWEAARKASQAPPRGSQARDSEAPKSKAGGARGKKALTFKERQEWDSMEARILAAEEARSAARAAAEDPAIARDAAALHARHEAIAAAEAEVERLYARWAELEAKQA